MMSSMPERMAYPTGDDGSGVTYMISKSTIGDCLLTRKTETYIIVEQADVVLRPLFFLDLRIFAGVGCKPIQLNDLWRDQDRRKFEWSRAEFRRLQVWLRETVGCLSVTIVS